MSDLLKTHCWLSHEAANIFFSFLSLATSVIETPVVTRDDPSPDVSPDAAIIPEAGDYHTPRYGSKSTGPPLIGTMRERLAACLQAKLITEWPTT